MLLYIFDKNQEHQGIETGASLLASWAGARGVSSVDGF
jgi:hypothetical protein